ncbi:MAG: hypothetical protein LC777_15885 [Actinobacteria bacterium]|nr:hypothetical protein [Actinomycetota bacterium]
MSLPMMPSRIARQVRVAAGELASYDFASRTAQRHRTEIRAGRTSDPTARSRST